MPNPYEKPDARELREQSIFALAPLCYRLRKGYMDPDDALVASDIAFAVLHGLEPISQELRYPVIHYRGIECGDGWLELVQDLSVKIERVLNDMVSNGVPVSALPGVTQIKQKFGSLSVHMRGFGGVRMPVTIRQILDEADHQASVTCELCSAPGALRKSGYITVLCDECEDRK